MLTIFTIVDGADARRFTLKKGNKLTFKATAFKAQSNTYRVKIKVFQERFDLNCVTMFLNTFVSLLLVISVITLSVFSGVETSAVVIRSAPSLSGLSPVLGLITVTVRVL
jgi:hypothetical protein